MNILRQRTAPLFVFTLALYFLANGLSHAAEPSSPLAAGTKLEQLTIGNITYQHVTIRSINARSVMITHDGGMKSLLLRDLSPELQQRFGYNPEAERAQEAKAVAGQAEAEKKQRERAATAAHSHQIKRKGDQGIEQLLTSFGSPPELQPLVDFRPKIRDYGLWVKDQGSKPSCAIFAIISALEFQYAELTGTPLRFSEEYLLWATAKTKTIGVAQLNAKYNLNDPAGGEIGFTLPDVVTAVRSYGILTQDQMPYRKGGPIEQPPQELINQAQTSQRVIFHKIPAADNTTMIANIVQALNAGYPVPIGSRWVRSHQIPKNGHLDKQTADDESSHAVTLVGYKCESGRIEDTVFFFKNSWGVNWGVDGYGTVTYNFLSQNLFIGVVLEVSSQ